MGTFSKVFRGFQNFAYVFLGVEEDVWRWLCRRVCQKLYTGADKEWGLPSAWVEIWVCCYARAIEYLLHMSLNMSWTWLARLSHSLNTEDRNMRGFTILRGLSVIVWSRGLAENIWNSWLYDNGHLYYCDNSLFNWTFIIWNWIGF